MEFPSIEQLRDSIANDYEISFCELELKDGFDYYVKRLENIAFTGDVVLDAGCGIGQWSCALSEKFAHVHAVDVYEKRLDVLRSMKNIMNINNIYEKKASILELPYPDEFFDGVFCYGVIMFTDIEKTLKEFFRVLKPKGKLYVCLNGDGWNKYLVEERGKTSQELLRGGQEILFTSYVERAMEEISKAVDLSGFTSDIKTKVESCGAFKQLANQINSYSHFEKYLKENLVNDVVQLYQGVKPELFKKLARCYMPQQIANILCEIGFKDFEWNSEGCIYKIEDFHQVKPKYSPYYNYELTVWEFICKK